jgi:hypothetical protein
MGSQWIPGGRIARARDVSEIPVSLKLGAKSDVGIMDITQIPSFLDRDGSSPNT